MTENISPKAAPDHGAESVALGSRVVPMLEEPDVAMNHELRESDPSQLPGRVESEASSGAGTLGLTVTEKADLSTCEVIIRTGLQTFVEVGIALSTIRDRRLYRVEFATFEEYVAQRWGMSGRQARRLSDAAQIAQTIGSQTPKTGPIGSTFFPLGAENTGWMVPANERQVRPLIGLPPNEQFAAWQEVITTAPHGRVTGALVERVVKARRIRLGLEPGAPSATQPKPAPAPNSGHQDALGQDRRQRQLAAADKAISSMQELQDVLGTPDSAHAAEVGRALEVLQLLKDHLAAMARMQANRPGRKEAST